MITRNIITAKQREQLIELARDLYAENIKLNGGCVEAEDDIMRMYKGAIQLITSAYSFYEDDERGAA